LTRRNPDVIGTELAVLKTDDADHEEDNQQLNIKATEEKTAEALELRARVSELFSEIK